MKDQRKNQGHSAELVFEIQELSFTNPHTAVKTTFSPAFVINGATNPECWASMRIPGGVDIYRSDTLRHIAYLKQEEDFFGHVVFNCILEDPFRFHFCEERDKLGKNNCGVPVIASSKNGDNVIVNSYFPVFKFRQDTEFRFGLDYITISKNGDQKRVSYRYDDDDEVKIFENAGQGREPVTQLRGLNGIKNISDYYLIPLVLPDRRVIYYATNEGNVTKWNNTLNAIEPNKSLIAAINTQAFDDDRLEIAITFDCDLQWVSVPVN
jgi:hypothetical protein